VHIRVLSALFWRENETAANCLKVHRRDWHCFLELLKKKFKGLGQILDTKKLLGTGTGQGKIVVDISKNERRKDEALEEDLFWSTNVRRTKGKTRSLILFCYFIMVL